MRNNFLKISKFACRSAGAVRVKRETLALEIPNKFCDGKKCPEMLQIDSTNQGLSNDTLKTFIQFIELIWHDCKV